MELQNLLQQLDWRAGLDILLVAFLLYQILAMLKGTRAAQVLIGILFIFMAYAVSSLLQLETINWIISKLYSSLIIVLIVLFQDDLRRMLSRMGSGPFSSRLEGESGVRVIDEVVSAAKILSHDRLGAILVFERGVNLERLHDYGIKVDSLVSEEILICIFQSFSPLHDGAVIVRNNRLSAASTQLPLSKNPDLTKKMGTRHSAALGVSEETDAVALVVSEETGHISIACDGELYRQASPEAARRMLIQLLLPTQKTPRWKIFLRRIMGGGRSRISWGGRRVKRKLRGAAAVRTGQEDISEERAGATASPHSTVASLRLRLPTEDGIEPRASSSVGLVMTQATFGKESAQPLIGDAKESEELEQELVESLDDVSQENAEEADVFMKNDAIRALTQLGPEDKFIPPSVPTTPPRDVSIGGVSLNPPIDRLNSTENKILEREGEETKKNQQETEEK